MYRFSILCYHFGASQQEIIYVPSVSVKVDVVKMMAPVKLLEVGLSTAATADVTIR
jgi:hypothetical protein